MAFYGSKAIRGHGIPEAMEQILTNQSKIKPSIGLYAWPIAEDNTSRTEGIACSWRNGRDVGHIR